MSLDTRIEAVTARIIARSQGPRKTYLDRMRAAAADGPRRAHLTCGNQAHAYAAMEGDKDPLVAARAPNLGIVTAYNDMLSAHKPFENFPERIKAAARANGATAQVAGGVPAMCDGVTQGQVGMELSLFSRDVIALAAGVALSHNTFDAAIYLGVCDKIVPGLVISAATFGYLPSIFLPAGPMTSGLPNDEKAKVRQKFAVGEVGFMGLHLPGASFVNPHTPLRDALTDAGVAQVAKITALGDHYRPVCDILDEKAFVNGLVGLMATGGSTNLVIHLVAMARAAGVILEPQDFADISAATPLMARVYPNGLADVNHFHAAGGLGFMIGELLDAGLLHPDTQTVMGQGLAHYTQEPKLSDGEVVYQAGPKTTLNEKILRPAKDAFQSTGGLVALKGNLGEGVMKVSAVAPERQVIEAPAAIFHDQASVKAAFQSGDLNRDVVVVVRFQGPKANGMPELHNLQPILAVLQDRGHKVALVTDGRMSGASGKVPAAIHVSPEALDGGLLARLQEGDMIRVDAVKGVLEALVPDLADRAAVTPDLSANGHGIGRELFEIFRAHAGPASSGAGVVV